MRTLKSVVYLGVMLMLLQLSGACLSLKGVASPVFTPSVTTSPATQATRTSPTLPSALPASFTPEPCFADFIPFGFWPDNQHILGQQHTSRLRHDRLEVLDLTTGRAETILELPALSTAVWTRAAVWVSLTADHSLVGIPQPGGDSIQIFDLDHKRELFSLTGHTDASTVLAFSPHDDKLYTSRFSSVNVWDRNGKLLSTFKPSFTLASGTESNTQIIALAVSPDGTQLAALPALEGEVAVHSAIDFRKLASYRGSIIGALAGAHAAFSPDNRYLAVTLGAGRGDVSLWRLSNGELLWQGGFSSYAFSSDEQLFARTEPGAENTDRIVISSADGQRNLRTLGDPSPYVISDMFFSPDSEQLAAYTLEGRMQVWRVADDQLVFSYKPTCK